MRLSLDGVDDSSHVSVVGVSCAAVSGTCSVKDVPQSLYYQQSMVSAMRVMSCHAFVIPTLTHGLSRVCD